MRLYPKKLRNIEELERERKLLIRESKRLDKDEFLSLEGLLNKGGGKGDSGNEGYGALLDLIPVSNPIVGVLINLVKQRLAGSGKTDKPGTTKKSGKNILRTVAVEVIGSYLKWKAVELSYKGLRHLVKKRQEKRAANQ